MTSGKKPQNEKRDQASIWERLQRPAPPPRVTLTPERIARCAVGIADRDGLDAVTMRRLAAELSVAPMAAYRYVTGKDELLELMADHVYGELELPEERGSWREAMRTLALRLREVLLRHPWMVQAAWSAPTPNQLAVPEAALAALDGLGLDCDATMDVYRAVTAYVNGAVNVEISLTQLLRVRGWSTPQEARSGLASQMQWLLGTGRFPMYARYVKEAARKDDLQGQFERGLDYVLDGITSHLRDDRP